MGLLNRDMTCFRKCFGKIDHEAHMQGALERDCVELGTESSGFVVVSVQKCQSSWFLFPMP